MSTRLIRMRREVWLLRVLMLPCFFFSCRAAYTIDDISGIGRTFDGIGGLSGGGATSKLLVNYAEPMRSQILDYLFKPNFGASLQILKVEIGGDGQTTDGTESSHMHESWDENYQRGYEWWLMVEAKKRNPAIKLYALPWSFPGWLGRGTFDPYRYPNDTATYITKWILAAKKYYDLDIDYIGIWNERDYSVAYVETLKGVLMNSGLTMVKIVVGDGDWSPGSKALQDKTFAAAFDVIGCHYPGTTSTSDAQNASKPLWASEDYSTFNDNVGAGCWARILNQNYVNGYMTSTISWNLIASYYEALPFTRDGLMTADEPWSGHYVVDNPVWISAHTTQFTEIGWSYLSHDHGVGHLESGGSFVSLISPDKDDLTIVIETMTHDHSICIRPGLPAYNLTAQQAEFTLKGNLADIKELHVWKTHLMYDGSPSIVFEKQASIKPYMGMFAMALDRDQIYTLTTLSTGLKGSHRPPPRSAPFPLPFADNFDRYPEFSEAYDFAPQVGVWEVRQTKDPSHKMVNRQVVQDNIISWCMANFQTTLNVGGDFAWSDVLVEIDVFIPSVNGSAGVFVAVRVDRGGCDSTNAKGVFFFIFPSSSTYSVSTDVGMKTVIASGTVTPALKKDTWYTLGLIIKGTTVWGFLNSTQALFTASAPTSVKSGFVGYGTSTLDLADFDNISIRSPDSVTYEDLYYYKSRSDKDKNVSENKIMNMAYETNLKQSQQQFKSGQMEWSSRRLNVKNGTNRSPKKI